MEILNSIKSLYDVQERDGFLLLWSKTEHGRRYPHKFICSLKELTVPYEGNGRKSKKVIGTGYFTVFGSDLPPTQNVKTLLENIDKHVASLPYDSEYYIPSLRKGLFEDFIIHDYLVETLGFKHLGYNIYEMSQKNVYNFSSHKFSISFNGLDANETLGFKNWSNEDVLPKKVSIKLHTGDYSWVEIEVDRSVEDIKAGIDSMIKPMLVSDSVNSFSTSEKMKKCDFSDLELLFNNFDMKSGELLSADYKSTLKNKLIQIASTL